MGMFRVHANAYTPVGLHSVPKKKRIVVSGTFMQPDFVRKRATSQKTIDRSVRSNIKNDTSARTNEYFSNGPRLVRFSAGTPTPWNPPIPSSTPLPLFFRACRARYVFAFSPRCSTPLQPSPRLLFTTSLPLTVGEFFNVHLFRRTRSSDCLRGCTKELEHPCQTTLFLFFLPFFLLVIYRFFFINIYLDFTK